MYCSYLQTPIGILRLVSSGSAITEISICDTAGESCSDALTEKTSCELSEYFAGTRKSFDLPLAPQGTEFQKTVWNALQSIPYGSTVTYGEIAEQISKFAASRAVGGAAGKNPILILQPCHRVLASNGIGGFSAGIEKKRLLLALEKGDRL